MIAHALSRYFGLSLQFQIILKKEKSVNQTDCNSGIQHENNNDDANKHTHSLSIEQSVSFLLTRGRGRKKQAAHFSSFFRRVHNGLSEVREGECIHIYIYDVYVCCCYFPNTERFFFLSLDSVAHFYSMRMHILILCLCT